jgi:hypothetical protein
MRLKFPGVGLFCHKYLHCDSDKSPTITRGEIPMMKRSIGKLRSATRTTEKSPNLTGKLALQRTTLNELVSQMRESGETEITCNIAGWFNVDSSGKYITIELSPLFRKITRPASLEEFTSDFGNEWVSAPGV